MFSEGFDWHWEKGDTIVWTDVNEWQGRKGGTWVSRAYPIDDPAFEPHDEAEKLTRAEAGLDDEDSTEEHDEDEIVEVELEMEVEQVFAVKTGLCVMWEEVGNSARESTPTFVKLLPKRKPGLDRKWIKACWTLCSKLGVPIPKA